MTTRGSMMTTVAALAALALAVAALGMLLARPQTTAAAESGGLVRQITVVGSGDVKVVPDTVQVQVGVQTQAPSAQAALNDNNAQMAALLNKLREAGIAPTDIQTSNVSVWPRYTGDGRTVEGYEANNSVTVKIHDITRTGELLDQVVAAGANTISGVSFTVDDPKALQQNARNAALTDARARAEAMAQSIGGSLGQVLSITENIGTPPPQPYRMEMAQTGAGTSSVPIQPGEQTITAQVQVTYELR